MSKIPFLAKTDEDVKMVFDPYRLRIIYALDRSVNPLTVKQLAALLKEPANKVHYHVKKLFDFGYFELVKTENINGIIAKYYATKFTGPYFDTSIRKSKEFPGHVLHLTKMVDNLAEEFKESIVAYSNLRDENGNHPGGGLDLNHITLYMTQKEAHDVINQVANLLSKYMTPDETKQVYTTLQTIARIK